jgi:hypothetical protein
VDGHAFYFVGLSDESSRRLAALVERLLGARDTGGASSPARN